MIAQVALQSRKDQVEQVQRLWVCVVKCMYNTRPSLATVTVSLLCCLSPEVLLQKLLNQQALPAVLSCLCSWDSLQTCFILLLVTFPVLIPPLPPPSPVASAQTGLFSSIISY